MTDVTDEDRQRALAAIKASSPEVYVNEYVIDGDLPPLIETIAAALAEERERAYRAGWDEGWTEGNRDGMAAGMGDV